MYNPIKTIISVLIIATFKFVLVFGNSEIVLASSRFVSNYPCSDTGKVYRKWCIKTNGEKRITIGNSKRNPGGNAMIGILKLIVFCIFYLSASSKVIATSYKAPTSKTNVNAQTDLFRKSVGDVEAFKSQVQEEEREAIEKLRSGVDHGVEFIAGTSRKEIDENTSELSAIKADELNDRGSTQLLREKLLEEIYVDESNPLMVAHRKDAERIAEGSKDLLGSLLLSLKERLGVDCYTVKGNKELEPEHRIKLKEEQIKETIYDQTMCEEPRNRYNCHDVLTTSCKRRGAVGELKYIVNHNFVPQLLQGTRRLGYDDGKVLTELYGTTAPLHLVASSLFVIPEGHTADMIPYSSVIKEIIIKSINTDTITVPPHRFYWPRITRMHEYDIDARIQGMAVQKRTGEWYEEQIIRIKNGLKLYYYDEGCVEWVDEWDEVCGLES